MCNKWSYLIAERTKKVKYLMETRGYSLDCVYFQGRGQIDVSCLSKLFTNLMIVELNNSYYVGSEEFVAFVRNQASLKGLILTIDKPVEKYRDQLEMVSFTYIRPNFRLNGSSIKQLHTWHYLDFKRYTHYFPNLEKLNIIVDDSYYDGPALEKLKILEIFPLSLLKDSCYAFQFMDSCPNLQSAHMTVHTNDFFVDETLKHKCLRDLVIIFSADQTNWNNLKRLLMKYPNLKHLALRTNQDMKDEHIEELVRILPNLVLLDVRGCNGVTQSAFNHVQDYCKRYGRSTKFYFNGNQNAIESDWPHLSSKEEKISRGFDFMKHCFLKKYQQLPCFLIPDDYWNPHT
ncbi:uncharacterized protein LOC107360998 isoform X2 [Tetranychus urticae]|uniref:uncharacterized protein LOC107360998 isoform X2 n=1 Tax=Tetranychus urticae TaxID=32264 RepID=UPI000D649146|nr:uncharacterized protein LOC107360998 isoform X2 [Tetranychus urticae]